MADEKEKIEQSKAIAPVSAQALLPAEFWGKIGRDLDKGVDLFYTELNSTKDLVIARAIVESFNDDHTAAIYMTDGQGRSFSVRIRRSLKENALGLVVLSAALALVGLFMFFGNPLVITGNQFTVLREGGLPAYHKIGPGDVAPSTRVFQRRSPNAENLIEGNYVLSKVAQGARIDEKYLLSQDLLDEMKDRLVMSIPIKADSVNEAISPNSKIGLVFANIKGNPEKSKTLNDIVLLGVERRGEMVTLVAGLTDDQINAVNELYGDSQIFIIQEYKIGLNDL